MDTLEKKEEVCEFCGGEGEVTIMEQVYRDEPHMAPIGTRICVCKIRDNEEEYDNQNPNE